jgi:transcriptional regulator with XRE-family HTH domain
MATAVEMTEALGARLKGARIARRMSLETVSSEAKISQGYLHKLEAGRVRSPNPRVLQRLSGVLEVPYRDLMALADYLLPADDAAAALEALRRQVAELQVGQERLFELLRPR